MLEEAPRMVTTLGMTLESGKFSAYEYFMHTLCPCTIILHKQCSLPFLALLFHVLILGSSTTSFIKLICASLLYVSNTNLNGVTRCQDRVVLMCNLCNLPTDVISIMVGD